MGRSSRSPHTRGSALPQVPGGCPRPRSPYARGSALPRPTRTRPPRSDRPVRAGAPTTASHKQAHKDRSPTRAEAPTSAGKSMHLRCALQHCLDPQVPTQQTMPAWRSRSAQGGDQEDHPPAGSLQGLLATGKIAPAKVASNRKESPCESQAVRTREQPSARATQPRPGHNLALLATETGSQPRTSPTAVGPRAQVPCGCKGPAAASAPQPQAAHSRKHP